MNDPDRFFDHQTPGAHEWWYFDAISADGRDVVVIVWYAGLPFDPSYGVAALRHLKHPGKTPAPRALDHSAIGFSWYREGKTMAYALNGFKADHFQYQADPFAVTVGHNRVERDGQGYRLNVTTPTVEGKPIQASFRFLPADANEPFERDLGSTQAPHWWVLAASDCRVEGKIEVGDTSMEFIGRGYHDHNAGAEEMSLAMKRWEWGRVHRGSRTDVYYMSEARNEDPQTLWITCRDGRPEVVREALTISGIDKPARNVFGITHHRESEVIDNGDILARKIGACLDDGPFYQRWLAEFDLSLRDLGDQAECPTLGIAEATRHPKPELAMVQLDDPLPAQVASTLNRFVKISDDVSLVQSGLRRFWQSHSRRESQQLSRPSYSWRKRMLVLSRKQFEGIQIGHDIRIKVVKVDRNQVRLGIEAPDDVLIVREELVHDAEVREARTAWETAEPTAGA